MVEWDLVMVEGLVQAMEMKVDVINHQENRIVAVAIAIEWDLDMGRVPDPEADVVSQDTVIAQEVTGEVAVVGVSGVMKVVQAAIGVVEEEKAAIRGAFQDFQTMNI